MMCTSFTGKSDPVELLNLVPNTVFDHVDIRHRTLHFHGRRPTTIGEVPVFTTHRFARRQNWRKGFGRLAPATLKLKMRSSEHGGGWHVSEHAELRASLRREVADCLERLATLEDQDDPESARFWREAAALARLGGGQLWTTQQCAEHCDGVSASTYRDYVKRLGAPGPVAREPGRHGQNLYDADAVRQWQASRAGQGHRSDLDQQ